MAASDALHGLDFSHTLRDAESGTIIKPLLRNYLYDAEFPEFDLHFAKKGRRKPDGWFHPSTHPLMQERELWLYLTRPDDFPVERLDFMSTLNVTFGTVLHEFVEMCLTDMGLRPKDLNRCTTCPPKNRCTEPGAVDEETGSRGHMDGKLDFSRLSVPKHMEFPGLEFKSRSRALTFGDLDLEAFKVKFPEYYAQVQEYMRISGLRGFIVFFIQWATPWEMTEIHIPYDRAEAHRIRDKYLTVREAERTDVAPACCRMQGKRSCSIRKMCDAGYFDTPASETTVRGLAL